MYHSVPSLRKGKEGKGCTTAACQTPVKDSHVVIRELLSAALVQLAVTL